MDENPPVRRRTTRAAARSVRPPRRKRPVEGFFGRHPRLHATIGCAGILFLTSAVAVAVWQFRTTDGTGWTGWVIAGLVFPLALIAVTVFCLRRRRGPVLRRVGTISGLTLLAGYLAGLLALLFGALQPGAGPVLAGLLAQTLPVGVFLTAACGWIAIRPPYRMPRWIRWLLLKI